VRGELKRRDETVTGEQELEGEWKGERPGAGCAKAGPEKFALPNCGAWCIGNADLGQGLPTG